MVAPLVVANWKMQLSRDQAVATIKELRARVRTYGTDVEIVVCPSFTALRDVSQALARSKMHLGAQNMAWDERGAYTGEISPLMLREFGVQHVILGHSERRQILHEDDVMIARKMISAVSHGLLPILCVGETAHERSDGQHETIIRQQVSSAVRSLPPVHGGRPIAIAYEPIWAIGTGEPAHPDQALAMREIILHAVIDRYGEAGNVPPLRILYGGSVTAENITDYVGPGKFDGALIGGASLEAASFATILHTVKHTFTRL